MCSLSPLGSEISPYSKFLLHGYGSEFLIVHYNFVLLIKLGYFIMFFFYIRHVIHTVDWQKEKVMTVDSYKYSFDRPLPFEICTEIPVVSTGIYVI
jgi:hypothetical protein